MILFSCESQDKKTQTPTSNSSISTEERKDTTPNKITDIQKPVKLELINLGESLDKFRSIYSQFEIINEPLSEYGIDSESSGYTVLKDSNKILFVWTMQNNNQISGIEVLSDDFVMKDGIRVGMSVEDFKKLYPSLKIFIDQLNYNSEYIEVAGLNYNPRFKTSDTTRIAIYKTPQSSSYSINVIRPDKKIDVISITK